MENKDLIFKPVGTAIKFGEKYIKAANEFCEGYKKFLDSSKTEREAVKNAVLIAEKKGFKNWDREKKLKAGDKIYYVNRNKSILLAVIGSENIEKGINMLVSHIDSPRLDLKQKPLYEDSEIALLKTHYYGGIKKYQWTTIPLALHGVIVSGNKTIEVKIGEDEGDPVFYISDLLPHLAREQMEKKIEKAIEGEDLNIITGSLPFNDEKVSEKFKYNVLKILNEKYGIVEKDLFSAEFEVVPAFKAKDVGLDRSLLGSYGQDDRVCSYASLMAITQCEKPEKTVISILADKEEIGFVGTTALTENFLRDAISEISENLKGDYRKVIRSSACLSCDVDAAFDPTFAGVYDKNNSAFLGRGVGINKFTGSRGKSGSSDASAEYTSKICRFFDDNEIQWQICELGKVDAGGGGTFAMVVASLGIDVIDVGTALLSMHSPYEVASKLDIYTTYQAYSKFINKF